MSDPTTNHRYAQLHARLDEEGQYILDEREGMFMDSLMSREEAELAALEEWRDAEARRKDK